MQAVFFSVTLKVY